MTPQQTENRICFMFFPLSLLLCFDIIDKLQMQLTSDPSTITNNCHFVASAIIREKCNYKIVIDIK